MKRALVAGAGGFIGGHLVEYLKAKDYYVVGVDIKEPEFRNTVADEFYLIDLRYPNSLGQGDFDECYQLSANMGGMFWITHNHSEILHDNALINIHMVDAFKDTKTRYFYSSSACVYPEFKQEDLDAPPLREEDAWPAQPQDAYGIEKLVSEKLCYYARLDHDMDTHFARFHNTYGPFGAWTGGREKAPAALCRKVAEAKMSGKREIEVWGDGLAQRTYLYVSDLVEGIYRLTQSDHPGPVNLGSTEQVTVDELAMLISDIAHWEIEIVHVPGPQGVRSRNSDNSLAEKVLRWTPKVSLRQGLELTYPWIEEQVRKAQ